MPNTYVIATSAPPQPTPVPERATFEEKYNTLLEDYNKLQNEYQWLERRHRLMKKHVIDHMQEIQTANKQIKDRHQNIHDALFAMQFGLANAF